MAVLPALGGCSFTQQIAESSVSYYSSDHFTLVATVPANFGFTSKAHYYPKPGQTCEVYSSGLGGYVTRQQQKSNTVEAKAEAQTASTDIPLEYHIAGCSMELARVSYEVNSRYGTGSLDRDLELAGGLSVRSTTSSSATAISSGPIEQRGVCTWYFKISNAKIKKGEIEKILSCEAVGPEWEVTEDRFKRRKPGGVLAKSVLADKTVHVEFRLSSAEKPYYQNYWFKALNGWKPCTGRWNSDREELCITPPLLRKFKQNGRECTVYPNCVEPGAVNE